MEHETVICNNNNVLSACMFQRDEMDCDNKDGNDRDFDIPENETDSSHFAILCASTAGHVAFTSPNHGRYLTQTFVAITAEASHDKTFIEIVQEVKTRIQSRVEDIGRACRPGPTRAMPG